MALELRLQQKMTQQLVMTPQLQQAIKLLQLSHLELAEALQKEMEENPVLEDRADGGDADDVPEGQGEDMMGLTPDEPSSDGDSGDGDAGGMSETRGGDGGSDGEIPDAAALVSDMATVLESAADSTPEPTNKEVEREIDWDNYMDSYSYALPASAGGGASDDMPPFEATLTKSQSLHEHLRWQVHMSELSDTEKQIAGMLIEEVNDDGYLSSDAIQMVVDEQGVTQDAVLVVLRELQEFEPLGVFARDLRECLLLQTRAHDDAHPLVFAIIDKHLKHVEKRNYQAIAKDLKIAMQEVGEAVKLIAQLDPRPGRAFSDKEPQYIAPDIYVHKVGDGYAIVLNEDGLPRLKISSYYRDAIAGQAGQNKAFIQDKLRSAQWLIRSIHMRQRTIYRVMESILKFQRDFFEKGFNHLKPLILKDVAEDVGMHESTISRVTSNKYVHTPQGIFELKYFFNSSINRVAGDGIASESVRNQIKEVIDAEDPHAPASDQHIVELLKQRNIDIARRTVAKYREMMRIAPSSQRRKVF